jgi:hypothetical protein
MEKSWAVWTSVTSVMAKYGVTQSMFLWFLWMSGATKLVPGWKPVLDAAITMARWGRTRYNPVNYGPTFDRFRTATKDAPRSTHTFMHGKATLPVEAYDTKLSGNNARSATNIMRYGALYVPADEMESFLYKVYTMLSDMRDAKMTDRYLILSMTEVKDAENTWRLVLDVDVELHDYDDITLTQSIESCEVMRESMTGWLEGIYVRTVNVTSEWGTWRLKFKYDDKLGRLVFILRGSIHFYTDVVVNAESSVYLGMILSEKINNIPNIVHIDPCSFTPTPMRIPGCFKVARCPFYEHGKDDMHVCSFCASKKNVVIAPPYTLPPTFEVWRSLLTRILPGETLWELPLIGKYRSGGDKRKAADMLVTKAVRARIEKANPSSYEDKKIFDRVYSEFRCFGYPAGGITRKMDKMFFNTTCRMCPFKGGEHSSNTLYYYADPDTQTLSIRCHHRYKSGQTHTCNLEGYPASTKYLDITPTLRRLLFGEDARDGDDGFKIDDSILDGPPDDSDPYGIFDIQYT